MGICKLVITAQQNKCRHGHVTSNHMRAEDYNDVDLCDSGLAQITTDLYLGPTYVSLTNTDNLRDFKSTVEIW